MARPLGVGVALVFGLSVALVADSLPGSDPQKKVVLAYSGGLDTSVILKWLQDTYRCEVVTFTADIGQGEELSPARAKAKKMGHLLSIKSGE